jgi:hypothetical protein
MNTQLPCFAGTALLGMLVAGPVVLAQPQPVTADTKPGAIEIHVAGREFARYLIADDQKYPYFFPVNAPGTDRSLTVHKTEPYPHHSSLFFGCDRVNGGNYWQEGLERGRIIPQETKVVEDAGWRVVIEQHCRWERPGAPAPFQDERRIVIAAPTADLYTIDFTVTLRPLMDVKIERNNHALFSGRMAPDLAVKGGGRLVNAAGESGEQATFGKVSPWMNYAGERDGTVQGLAILSHPDNRWHPPQWFTRDYGFFSPTPMNWLPAGGLNLKPGESITLRYLAVAHTGALDANALNDLLQEWATGQ